MTKGNVSYQDKINELRLDFMHPNTKNKVFILFEGDNDVRLYRKLYPQTNLKIEFLPSGKYFLEKGLQELSLLFKQIIGIRDADFAHLENQKPSLANLFFTDYHDTEMLMVASNVTFSAILHEFCNLPQAEHEKIRTKLLEAVQFISYFRWYNELNNLEFSFEAKLGDIFDPKTFTIDSKKYITKIISQSPNAKIRDIDIILTQVANLKDENHDNFQLCNGHDFMSVLALFLNTHNQEGLSGKRVSSHFRIAYHFSEYQQTKLHLQIHRWAISHSMLSFF